MSSRTLTSRPFSTIASGVFALLAIGHVLRLVFALEVQVDGMIVPLGVSIPVAMIATGLAFFVWRESRS